VQKCRFGDKLSLEVDMENEELLEARMPKLILQPLVENAIVHGLEGKIEDGTVRVRIENSDRTLFLSVRDDGVGMPGEEVDRMNRRFAGEEGTETAESDAGDGGRPGRRGGIALANVNARIRLMFGEDYGLQIYSVEGAGTECRLTLPLLFEQ
jgi:two-component system sensor histidine kinase YesM